MQVLIDSTVLANFIDVKEFNVFNLIRSALPFSKLIVPETVKNELANCPADKQTEKRRKLLSDLETTGPSYYELCTSYDPIVYSLLSTESNIDAGEAEMVAQAIERKIYVVFTDDKPCIHYLEKNFPEIRQYNSCLIIAMLDIYGVIGNEAYFSFIKNCLENFHFNRKKLQEAYIEAYKILGREKDKKHIQARLYTDSGELLVPKKKKNR